MKSIMKIASEREVRRRLQCNFSFLLEGMTLGRMEDLSVGSSH
jgi:hypothetical protein